MYSYKTRNRGITLFLTFYAACLSRSIPLCCCLKLLRHCVITLHEISNSESQLTGFVAGGLLTPFVGFYKSVAVAEIIILTTALVLITPKQIFQDSVMHLIHPNRLTKKIRGLGIRAYLRRDTWEPSCRPWEVVLQDTVSLSWRVDNKEGSWSPWQWIALLKRFPQCTRKMNLTLWMAAPEAFFGQTSSSCCEETKFG